MVYMIDVNVLFVLILKPTKMNIRFQYQWIKHILCSVLFSSDQINVETFSIRSSDGEFLLSYRDQTQRSRISIAFEKLEYVCLV